MIVGTGREIGAQEQMIAGVQQGREPREDSSGPEVGNDAETG